LRNEAKAKAEAENEEDSGGLPTAPCQLLTKKG